MNNKKLLKDATIEECESYCKKRIENKEECIECPLFFDYCVCLFSIMNKINYYHPDYYDNTKNIVDFFEFAYKKLGAKKPDSIIEYWGLDKVTIEI